MQLTRRQTLKGIGYVTVAAPFMGCGDGSGTPPLPGDLPEYDFTGTPGPAALFTHGVASGDPLADGVVLWTRVSPESGRETVEVWWEVALDVAFEDRVAQGTLTTDASADFTAKVDVRELVWGRHYYFRFFALGIESPTGRTRLAPGSGEADRLRIGVASCASLGHGFFHAYARMAERPDLDVVLHLGDYIYEYGSANVDPTGGYGRVRDYEPSHEIVTLDDYRTRYAQYRREPELQVLHQQVPFITIWDDHETANNSHRDGAENHQPDEEGDWNARKAAATQAYFEWMPIRQNESQLLYRTLQYGDLADIVMLDTRIVGREEPGDLVVLPNLPDLPEQLLGSVQETWVQEELTRSAAQWQIIGNQVVMGLWKAGVGDDAVYVNGDQWNGYPAARDRMLAMLRDRATNPIVVTGDVHSSWSIDLTFDDDSYDVDTGAGSVGVEFVTPGITSPGSAALAGLARALLPDNPHVRYADFVQNGYLVLDVTADKVQADWYHMDGIQQGEGAESFSKAFAVMAGERFATEMNGPEPTAVDQPDLAPA